MKKLQLTSDIMERAYTLHRLANNVGQMTCVNFLLQNNIDLNLLTKAIRQNIISKYHLRDIINGSADKFSIKEFKYEFRIK